jgi:hypothetical protein
MTCFDSRARRVREERLAERGPMEKEERREKGEESTPEIHVR